MNLGDALAWLDRHQNLERILADTRLRAPRPERVRALVRLMDDPQDAQPAVHVTGTNGKTSTARALTQLFMFKGLTVGTFISPHLEKINERIMVNLEPISDGDLAEVLTGLAGLEPLLGDGLRPSWFELMTAAAFVYFADRPVDVAVIEVGMGGRWDATNVVDGDRFDRHQRRPGPHRAAGADPGAHRPGEGRHRQAGGDPGAGGDRPRPLRHLRGREPRDAVAGGARFRRREQRDGGRRAAAGPAARRGPRYEDVYLPLHGRHQADNFMAALAGAEAFFGRPVEPDIVAGAAASVSSPGRLEVVRQHPLVVLDGAKNVAGAQSSSAAVREEFGDARAHIMVVGMLGGKSASEMLEALDARTARLVVTCPPPSPRAQPAEEVAAVARSLGCRAVSPPGRWPRRWSWRLAEAGEDDLVLVTGSLYTVGAARTALVGQPGLQAGRGLN